MISMQNISVGDKVDGELGGGAFFMTYFSFMVCECEIVQY